MFRLLGEGRTVDLHHLIDTRLQGTDVPAQNGGDFVVELDMGAIGGIFLLDLPRLMVYIGQRKIQKSLDRGLLIKRRGESRLFGSGGADEARAVADSHA